MDAWHTSKENVISGDISKRSARFYVKLAQEDEGNFKRRGSMLSARAAVTPASGIMQQL